MKLIPTLFILIVLNSCALVPSISFPSYVVESKTNNLKLNTSEGNWLFLETSIPFELQSNIKNKTNDLLKNHLGNRLLNKQNTTILVPGKLSLNPDKSILEDIKNGNDIDYLILLEVGIRRNDFSDYSLIPSSDNSTSKQVVSEINVFDLSKQSLIYNKQVKGIIQSNANDGPVYTKNINKLAKKSFEKLLNEFSKDLENFQ